MMSAKAPIALLSGLILSAFLLVLVGCEGTGDGAPSAAGGDRDGAATNPAVSSLIDAAQAEITVEAMDEELDSIVQYERLSGEPGEIAAVDYLVRTLQAEGIQVAVDTFLAYISDPVSATVEVPGTDLAPEAITISGSGNVRNLQAPVVDLGGLGDLPPYLTETGERLVLDADGPAGSAEYSTVPDLRGQIALVTGQPRPGPVVQLTEMGAAGVVFVNPEERLNDLTVTSVWGTPSLRDFHRIPTLPVAEIKRSDGDRLRSMMAEGPVEIRMSTETRTGWKPLHLAAAIIPGPAPGGPFVLAGGHLDSWHFGGTDNAGANVAMLEMARAFSRHQDRLLRGLVIAWWPGHSNGRYAGSTWYVDQHFDELRRRAVAHVNFEGLGQIDAKRFGASTSASMAGLARTVVMEGTGESIPPSPPGRNSDQSFNGVGLPLLQINHSRLAEDGGYWWWHTPDDTRDKVDATVLKVDADLYAGALARLLAEPVLPVDLSAPVERLGSLLADRQEMAGEQFDLGEAMVRQAGLLSAVEQVEEALAEGASIPGAGSSGGASPDLDLALVAILRPIHRILYTGLGPYHPDPAVTVGSLPGLNAVDMLAENHPSTDRFRMALTTLQREYPRILEAIDRARDEAEGVLNALGGG
ncbi:MAG: M28 family peptidase [Gemmatimonadetes bacterium]|nr:M28 family peptidase [Gemmatimonadota bacterium]